MLFLPYLIFFLFLGFAFYSFIMMDEHEIVPFSDYNPDGSLNPKGRLYQYRCGLEDAESIVRSFAWEFDRETVTPIANSIRGRADNLAPKKKKS